MARYLLEVTLAPQVFGTLLKNPHDRAEALRPVYEALGGKLAEHAASPG